MPTCEPLPINWARLRYSLLFMVIVPVIVYSSVIFYTVRVSSQSQPRYWKSDSDTATFVTIARNLRDHGVFSRENEPPYLWDP